MQPSRACNPCRVIANPICVVTSWMVVAVSTFWAEVSSTTQQRVIGSSLLILEMQQGRVWNRCRIVANTICVASAWVIVASSITLVAHYLLHRKVIDDFTMKEEKRGDDDHLRLTPFRSFITSEALFSLCHFPVTFLRNV
ncbi:hypothetical protein PFISCL1PPCAC_8278 [Pristionchus fissidentatus]|uniref:G protein-coupled receptor n=1 Tax=Pristionchus fissidentatus TaxID=1538716 RepID=A0AAV5VBC9_9BILA|nr:hypothetical protein PFISCL1PPCAC_8278 [Pristionchus fissidentatus]